MGPNIEKILKQLEIFNTYDPSVCVCVTSFTAQMKIKSAVNKQNKEQPLTKIEIIGSTEIESEHAFFFSSKENAQEFIESVKALKRIGYKWPQIMSGVNRFNKPKAKNG